MSLWQGVVRRQHALDHDDEVQKAKADLDRAREEYAQLRATETDKGKLKKAKLAFGKIERAYTNALHDRMYTRVRVTAPPKEKKPMMGGLRTKPSVEAGLVHMETSTNRSLYIYEPGNLTRYVVVVVSLSGMSHVGRAPLGAGDDGDLLVTLATNPSKLRSTWIPHGCQIDPFRVADKLGVSIVDGVCLGEMLGFVSGFPCISCEDFSRDYADKI